MTKKTAIIGLGLTGKAVLDYFTQQGQAAILLEELSKEAIDNVKKNPAYSGHEFYFEAIPASQFDNIDLIVTSPGIPMNRSWASEAKKRNIPIIGELEFASRWLTADFVSVTGTNGKSTTVSLIQAIFERAGISSGLKGNIGAPLITAVSEEAKKCLVVEVSSYQLETVEKYHSKVAVILNVTADHLDRYQNMADYAAAKENILKNQTENDFFIYNADDVACSRMATRAAAKKLPFSLVNQFSEGAFVDRQEMVVRLQRNEYRYSLQKAALKGLHNQENMLAALLAAHSMGVEAKVIDDVLAGFKGLRHRVELVHQKGGINFFDDSKGTNVGSVVMSLASFDKNVILLLGGKDKGGDYSPLKSLIKGKVKKLILFGEARDLINQVLGDVVDTEILEDMEDAFKIILQCAVAGDTVLLSPACSSFDQYKNYAQRGDHFKKLAQELF